MADENDEEEDFDLCSTCMYDTYTCKEIPLIIRDDTNVVLCDGWRENKWKKFYKIENTFTMRPYIKGEDMSKIKVWHGSGPVEEGGMIQMRPDDKKWYINKKDFEQNYLSD